MATKQNVTTLPLLDSAGPLALGDLLYIVQGEGKDRDRKLTIQNLISYISSAQAAVASYTVTDGTLDLSTCNVNAMISVGGTGTSCSITNYGNVHLGILRTLKGEACSVTLGSTTYSVPAKGLLVFTSFGSATVIRDASEAVFESITVKTVNVVNQGGSTTIGVNGINSSSGTTQSSLKSDKLSISNNAGAGIEVAAGRISGLTTIESPAGVTFDKKIVVTNGHAGATVNPNGTADFVEIEAGNVNADEVNADEVNVGTIKFNGDSGSASASIGGLNVKSSTGKISNYGSNADVGGYVKSDSYVQGLKFRFGYVYTSNSASDTYDEVLGQCPATDGEVRVIYNASGSTNVHIGAYAEECVLAISVGSSWKKLV